MRKIKFYQIDAFADRLFAGNPAGVCPLDEWLSEDLMQTIATENNLSETGFLVKEGDSFGLRWFTPAVEVDLCGHCTLACAFVLKTEMGVEADPICFQTKSGELLVSFSGDRLIMDFPAQVPEEVPVPNQLIEGLGDEPLEVFGAEDYLVVFESEDQIRSLKPDFALLKGLPLRGVITTAPGDEVDFVSRWFGPNVGVNEDPVTGSAHTTLTPYWAEKLGKTKSHGRQISKRGGEVWCELLSNGRVAIGGTAVKYLEGEISVPQGRTS